MPTTREIPKREAYFEKCQENENYPFASRFELELALFIIESRLSIPNANHLLKISARKDLTLATYDDLKERLKLIPQEVSNSFHKSLLIAINKNKNKNKKQKQKLGMEEGESR